MASAFALRSQIEAALADRIPSALSPQSRILREVAPTGVASVDEVLDGGLPVGALTEMIGAECSGRTSLALSFVAQVTQAEKVCAWVDVSNALSPESAAAAGVDLARLLWVRCGVVQRPVQEPGEHAALAEGGSKQVSFSLSQKYFVPRPAIKGLHGGGMGGHPRAEAKGMDEAVSSLLRPEAAAGCAKPQPSVRTERESFEPAPLTKFGARRKLVPLASSSGRPWPRIEQALRVSDLLLQAGGFGAIVLDLGSIAPEHVMRIPLATWFRYRAAAERTRSSILLLTQYASTKSSAGLVLRMRSGDAVSQGSTVLAGLERSIEVLRQRFTPPAEKVVPMRKPPQRAGVAAWRSQTAWAGRR
jgi:recombination protein RecA